MLRYLRLYGYFVRFSISRSLEFRINFFFRIVMDLAFYAVNLAFFKVLFLHTPMLAGWSEPQALVFAAGYLVVDALNMTIFSNNLWIFPLLVNRGDLDYYLVRPVSSLFFLSVRDFAVNSLINLFFALGILAWTAVRYPEPLGFLQVGGFVLLLIAGTFLNYLIHLVFLIPVFWTHSGRGFGMLFWVMDRFAHRPDRIYDGWVRRIITTILPFCLVASYPARLILDDFDPWVLAHFLGVIAVFFVLVMQFWKLALRSYSSASS